MNRSLTSALTVITILLLLTLSASAKDAEVEDSVDLSGAWKVLLSNSLTRKQVTFHITQKDGRLRGTVSSKEMPEQKLDGRLEKDKKFKLWGTFYDRSGASMEYTFRGTYEGEPGKEKLQGESEFFRKRYDFVGVRAKKKKKNR